MNHAKSKCDDCTEHSAIEVRLATLEADKKERKKTNLLLLMAIVTPLIGLFYDRLSPKENSKHVYEEYHKPYQQNQNYDNGRNFTGSNNSNRDSSRVRLRD